MKFEGSNMRSSSESNSSQKLPDEEVLQTFCKQMLKTKVFRGIYQERRYVESLKGYRDLVIVNSAEKELKADLAYIRQRINKFYMNEDLWVGVTLPETIGAPAGGLCIWTEIEELAFGNYWFYVKSVRFREREVMIKLKVLRPTDSQDDTGEDCKNIEINSETFKELWNSWKEAFSKTTYTFFTDTLCKENICAAIKFISILMLSLMTASIHTLKFLGVYTLLVMKELRMWVHTCTPIILKIIDLMTKVIGAFFILLTMLYRDIVGSARGQTNSYPAISAPPQSLHYRRIKRN